MNCNESQPQRVPFVINTDDFIEEIKRVPAIWNYRSEEYINKVKRQTYWYKIAGIFFADFNDKTAEDKREITTFLQKKWKNLRDNFTRYLFSVKKCQESGTREPRPYTYYQNLSFLLSLTALQCDAGGSPMKLEESSKSPKIDVDKGTPSYCKEIPFKATDNMEGVESTETARTGNRKRKKQEKISKKINKQLGAAKDEDRLFLLSLIGEFKKISDEHKLDARLEILQVIRKYKNLSENTQFRSSLTNTRVCIFVKEEPETCTETI